MSDGDRKRRINDCLILTVLDAFEDYVLDGGRADKFRLPAPGRIEGPTATDDEVTYRIVFDPPLPGLIFTDGDAFEVSFPRRRSK